MRRMMILIFTVMLICCGLNSTGVAETLETVLDKNIKALGGREALARIKSVISYVTVEGMGLSGKQIGWVKYPFQYRSEIDMGVMSQVIGFNGITGWSIDPNGMVKRDIAETLKPMINEMYYQSYSYALPGGNPGRTVYRGDTLIDGGKYHRLALFPEGGDSLSIYINASTGLVDYLRGVMTGLAMMTSYSDYRLVEGVYTPFVMVSKVEDPPYEIYGRLDSLRINENLPDSLFAVPGKSGDDFLFVDGADSVVLPFHFENNHIQLETMINGRGPYMFLLDSGAGMTFVAASLARELGIGVVGEVPARGVGGYSRIGFGEIDSLNFGGLSLYLDRITILDLETIAGGLLADLDGVLGYDFFARFPMKIDFVSEKITVYHPEYENLPVNGEIIPIDIFAQIPVMEGFINGQPIRLGVDLGAQPTMIIRGNARLYPRLKEQIGDNLGRVNMGGIGGSQSMASAIIDSLRFGRIILEKQSVLISEDFSGLPLPDYIEGLLGVGIMRDFRLLIDYPHGRICFERQP